MMALIVVLYGVEHHLLPVEHDTASVAKRGWFFIVGGEKFGVVLYCCHY